MTIVRCLDRDCQHNQEDRCERDRIEISCGECQNYENCRDQTRYKNKFWKACVDQSKVKYRIPCYGKRVEFGGMVFYTEDDDRWPDDMRLTEGRTGYACGKFGDIGERIEKIKEDAKEIPDVVSLPEENNRFER